MHLGWTGNAKRQATAPDVIRKRRSTANALVKMRRRTSGQAPTSCRSPRH